jgi:hypothetical protein
MVIIFRKLLRTSEQKPPAANADDGKPRQEHVLCFRTEQGGVVTMTLNPDGGTIIQETLPDGKILQPIIGKRGPEALR